MSVTLQFNPTQPDQLPWMISLDGTPAFRLSDSEHAIQALVAHQTNLEDGYAPAPALYEAVKDTAMQFNKWTHAE